MTPLERITLLANANGDLEDTDTLRPLVTLEDFFDGNEIVGSIGCNLYPEQAPAAIYSALKAIMNRDDVANVLVEIALFDDDSWPFSEKVWVITDASSEDVLSWFEESIAPSDCWDGWSEDTAYTLVSVPDGMKPVACWWD